MFVLSILLMVLPTFILAFIPGYETLGFCKRTSSRKTKSFLFKLFKSAMALGILLGSIVFLIINAFFSIEEIAYAWRIAFFVSGIFGIISIYLRRFLQETPIFKQMKKNHRLVLFRLKIYLKKRILQKIYFHQ